jgi:hypothetical protein
MSSPALAWIKKPPDFVQIENFTGKKPLSEGRNSFRIFLNWFQHDQNPGPAMTPPDARIPQQVAPQLR